MSEYSILNDGVICIKDAIIYSKNFAGEKFGKGGNKTFCVMIDSPEFVQRLENEGFNVRSSKPDEDGNCARYIPVTINFTGSFRDPDIKFVTNSSVVKMNEETIREFDNIKLVDVWVYINPYHKGDGTTTAYLRTMIAKQAPDYGYDYPYPDDSPFDT